MKTKHSYPSLYYDNWHGHDAILNEHWRCMVDHDATDGSMMLSRELTKAQRGHGVAQRVRDRIEALHRSEAGGYVLNVKAAGIY